jgi:replicative DNA helicase
MNPATNALFHVEAEQSVIGGLFVSPVAFADIAAILQPGDFGDYRHRLIFAAMRDLAKQPSPIDIVTVAERLESAGHCPDPVEMPYLVSMARDTPSAANVVAYAGVVQRYSHKRGLLQIADKMAIWARDDSDPSLTIAKVRSALESLTSAEQIAGLRVLADVLPDVLAELDERANRTQALLGLPTGLPLLDRLLDGLCAGRLYVAAGRPSSGKSVLGLQCAREAVRVGKTVAFFSLEMPAAEVVHRLLASDIPMD